jgi:2-polyprenyl-3-methyl-5-hydroxy-6-metoxy-1,4-benzoquinol methylase
MTTLTIQPPTKKGNTAMDCQRIETVLAKVFNSNTKQKRIFFWLLDFFLLKSWHLHRELKIWAAANPKPSHILDAGSGYGQYAYYVSKLSPQYNVTALDLRQQAICECNQFFRKQGLNNIFCRSGNLMELNQPESFNLIMAVDVMEYIEDDTKLFKLFYDDLKPDGNLLIFTQAKKRNEKPLECLSTGMHGEKVRIGYDMAELKQRLRKMGFKKVRARYSYGKAGKLSWALSMKFPFKLLSKSKLFLIVLPLYYAVMLPVCLLLNYLDTHVGHLSGTGMLLKAYK